ncbi:DUF697 domain-containing protein [Ectothiorhodospiraceae bacterium BW-2]|nr:DUF697 domain-containing protein [Ectothiorhodospiraceae bacterium BW-2]
MAVNHDPYFIPIDNQLLQRPEPVSGDSGLELLLTPRGEEPLTRLEPMRNHFIKPLLLTLLLTLLGWGGVELSLVLTSLYQWSHYAAMAVMGLLLLLTLLTLLSLSRFRQQARELQQLQQLRATATELRQSRGYGEATAYLKRLDSFYHGKPHYSYWQTTLAEMPDYNNNVETINHLSGHYLAELDRRALKRINSYSRQVGVAVALSPLALFDVLIALWRSLVMVDEVAQIYGVRPSAVGRYRLGKMMLGYLLFTSITELLGDFWEEAVSNQLLGTLSPKLMQGASVGLYTLIIGMRAMELMRPIPFNDEDRPKVGSLFKRLVEWLRGRRGSKEGGRL